MCDMTANMRRVMEYAITVKRKKRLKTEFGTEQGGRKTYS